MKNKDGSIEEHRSIVKYFKDNTLRFKVTKRNVDERFMQDLISIHRLFYKEPVSLQKKLGFLKKAKYPTKKKWKQKFTTVKEENRDSAISQKPNYRGSGVKFHIMALLGLGHKVDIMQRTFSQWIPTEEYQEIQERHQQPEKDIRKRPGGNQEIKYAIPLPQPQDRPPDKEITFREILYDVPLPQPTDRPPDIRHSAEKTYFQCPPDTSQKDDEKEQQKVEDWGRESILLCLKYINRPPFDPDDKCRLRKNETTEILYLLRYIQRPPFLEGPSYR